jgi:chaperone modulatory protein CbpM
VNPRRTRSRQPPVDETVEAPVELAFVARAAGLRVSVVRQYLALGLFDPCAGSTQLPLFATDSAARVAKAERLRRDLGLNHAGAVLVCELLDRIQALEDRASSPGGQ